ncbi:hypothetical protein BV898_01594 [Hypsibius exemplaris]|uniref:Cadherin domain-containing protein n=1 Tax=Hypsibius exemplaris TaxID=2072580 RepID=A0A1W0XAV1_HYPEX|nr:hypothetical protein BV898_01594 [Hypsibius exemplaris]
MDRSVNILGFFLVLTVSMNSTVVQCQNVTSTTQASNKATSDSLLFNVSAHGIGLLGRTLHKAANRQYSSGVLYTGSYSAPAPAASLTVNTYSPPSYGFSPPSSGQLVQTSDTYGSGSAALTGAPVAVSGGGATSYGGSFSSSYSTQLGGPSALLNTLYSSGYNSASAPIQQSNSGGNFYSSSSQSGNLQSVSSSYGSPSAPLVAAPSYGTPTAPLVQAPSYSSPSSSIIQTSVSYGTPSAPLVAAAPSYGSPSAPLVSAPSYGSPSSAIVQAATYGTPSAPLVQAPSSYGTPSAQLTQSSSSYSSGTSYGSPSAPLVQAPAPAPICAKGQYTVDVPDNTPTGVIVLRVVAIDSQNSPLRYEILDWTGLVSGKIIVNSQTGDLIVAASLQRNAARWLDFNVQVTNAQSQTCSSAVRLNFITTATPAPTVTYVGGSSYGGSPSAPIVQAPSSYGTPSAPLVQAPSSYGTPSAPLIQSPPSYAPPSAPLIQSPSYGSPPAAPLIQSPSSYGSPSSPLVQAPSSYPTPSAPLIQAPSYGAPSAPLIQAPSYGAPSAPLIQSPSYGAPSAPLIQSPSSYGTPSAPLVQAPTPSYGTPSAPLIQSPSYGSPSASLTSSSSYFSPGSSSLVFASSGSTYGGGGGNSNLVATPAPSTTYSYASPSYGGSNGNLVAQPTPPPPVYFPGDNGYSGGTQNLVATPAPAVNYGPSYGNSNQNLIATPAPAVNYAVSYGNANQNLIATPAPVPNYGGNQNLIATSAPSSYSAGSPAAPLTATNAPFVAIQNQLQAGTYGGVGSGNIQTGGGGYGIGGNIVQQVTQAPLYTATYPSYGGGGGSYGGNGGGTTQPQLSPSGVISGGAGVNFNPFGSGSTANNNVNFVDLFNPVVTSQQLIATPQPFNPVVSAQNLLPTTASGQAIIRTPTSGSTGSDSVPPTAATMNWSFFVPQFNGMTTVIGTLNGPSSNNVFTLSGNPFFTVDQAGSVSLISGYCPPRSPMQESVGVRAVSADGSAVVQGSLSVVVFVAPSYLRICNSQPIPTTMPSTVKQLTIPPPTTASTAGNGGQNGVAVTFIGDSSFTTTKCDGQSAGAPTQVAATIRARFTPNIDFSKLRITVSNSSRPSYGSPSAPLVSAPLIWFAFLPIVQAATYGTPSAAFSASTVLLRYAVCSTDSIVRLPTVQGLRTALLRAVGSSPAPAPICAKGQYTVDVPEHSRQESLFCAWWR